MRINDVVQNYEIHNEISSYGKEGELIELFEYKNNNPLGWPALHYALFNHRIDLARLALTFFPDEGYDLAREWRNHWTPPAEFQDWDCWYGLGDVMLLTSWEAAAINGYEDFAIELLQKYMKREGPFNPWKDKKLNRLYALALHLGQDKLLDYLFSKGVPMDLSLPKGVPGSFWPLLTRPEIMRVFLFHQSRASQNSFETLEDVPEKLIEIAIKYAMNNEAPLTGAFIEQNLDDFVYLLEMGFESFGQSGLELFKKALQESDPRYAQALCNADNTTNKFRAALDARRLDAVKLLCEIEPVMLGSFDFPRIYDEGHKELIRYLLSKNIGKSEWPLLDHAILAHDREMVDFLLDHGYCCSRDCQFSHPLRAAIQANDPEVLNRLLDLGFKVRPVYLHTQLFFYQEAAAADATEVFAALLERRIAPAPEDFQILTEKGYVKELELLIEKFPVEKPVLMDLIARAARANQRETYALLISKL